jgi:N-acyl homoserine lactone hydrolase
VPKIDAKQFVTRRTVLSASAGAIFSALMPSMESLAAAPKEAEPVTSTRLYVFDLGTLPAPADPYPTYGLKLEQLAEARMSVVGYLIVRPKGTLIWDTGVVPDERVGTDAKGADRAGKRSLKDQLQEVGYSESNITYLGLSHYHGDHSANANSFASSIWIVQKPERDAMFSETPPPTALGAIPGYDKLRDSKTIILLKVDPYDVFGDGTVLIKPAYGHTEGNQILMVKLEKTGWVALVGDLYHYPEERAAKTLTPNFDYNRVEDLASRARIEDYVKSMGAQMWIEHDYAFHQKLKKSPLYYD